MTHRLVLTASLAALATPLLAIPASTQSGNQWQDQRGGPPAIAGRSTMMRAGPEAGYPQVRRIEQRDRMEAQQQAQARQQAQAQAQRSEQRDRFEAQKQAQAAARKQEAERKAAERKDRKPRPGGTAARPSTDQ